MSKGKDTKPHIGIFGRRNNGKSALINALADQEIAIVSDVAGTTTDPVRKSMELPGIGPVVLVDTAGIDDSGDLGEKRIAKTIETLSTIDMAILVIISNSFDEMEIGLIKRFKEFDVPYMVVHNKSDIFQYDPNLLQSKGLDPEVLLIPFCSVGKNDTRPIMDAINKLMPESAYQSKKIVDGLVSEGEVALLITPVDTEAPEGRMILPQVQVIRDVLDHNGIAVVLKETQVKDFVAVMNPKPVLAVTDSQIFPKADALIPNNIPLTSFSILLARQKGDFWNYIKGTPHIDNLKDGDKVLILESCTHHVTCEDIGRFKIPRWLSEYTGKKLQYEVVSGLAKLPGEIKDYAMVIQCGGCVLTGKQVINRIKPAVIAGIPVSNYGMTIAFVKGIFKRAISPFQKKIISK